MTNKDLIIYVPHLPKYSHTPNTVMPQFGLKKTQFNASIIITLQTLLSAEPRSILMIISFFLVHFSPKWIIASFTNLQFYILLLMLPGHSNTAIESQHLSAAYRPWSCHSGASASLSHRVPHLASPLAWSLLPGGLPFPAVLSFPSGLWTAPLLPGPGVFLLRDLCSFTWWSASASKSWAWTHERETAWFPVPDDGSRLPFQLIDSWPNKAF